MSETPFRDGLARFVFEHGPVRGAVVSLDDTRAGILGCHPYPAPLAHVLSELIAAATLLASALKFGGSLILQLQGDGPVRLIVVECDAQLALRATAQWTDAIAAIGADADLATLVGGAQRGRFAIMLDPKDGGPIYQGIVALEAASVAGLIEHYLEASEQIPSRMLIQRDEARVRGVLVQRLPGSPGDDPLWPRTDARMDMIGPRALLDAANPATLLTDAFGEDDIRLFRVHPARFACSCTRERVENALRMIGQAEVEQIVLEQGEVRVTCEFCNRAYAFSPEAARALFAGPGRDAYDEANHALRH